MKRGLIYDPTTTGPSDFDLACASKLYDVVKSKGHMTAPTSKAYWAKAFSKLREINKLPESLIQEVLDWYCLHFGEDYVPNAQSGKTFRAKFHPIQDAMARQSKENRTIKISQEAANLASRLLNKNWPKCTKEDIQETVQSSLDAYRDFIKSLHRAEDDLPPKLRGFKRYLDGRLGRPVDFVEEWMTSIQSRIANWKEWSGNLYSWRFTVTNKQFQAMGHTFATEYCQDSSRWEKLLEAIHAD